MQNLYVAFDIEKEKLGCGSCALVIKNDALNAEYLGGLKAFLEKYGSRSNRHITVSCDMGSEFGEKIDDVAQHGLLGGRDFWVYDFWSYGMAIANGQNRRLEPHEIETEVDWLKAEFSGEGFRVWYVDGDGRKPVGS